MRFIFTCFHLKRRSFPFEPIINSMKNLSQLSTRCQFAPNTGGCNSLTAGRGEPGGSSSTGSEHLRPQLFITSSLFNAAIVCGNVRRQCKHWWSSSRKWQVRITLAGFHGIVTVQCVELIVTIIAVGFPSITTATLFNVKFTILHILLQLAHFTILIFSTITTQRFTDITVEMCSAFH